MLLFGGERKYIWPNACLVNHFTARRSCVFSAGTRPSEAPREQYSGSHIPRRNTLKSLYFNNVMVKRKHILLKCASSGFEAIVTWDMTKTGALWNTTDACSDEPVIILRALYSDENVIKGEEEATSSCGVDDRTQLIQSVCDSKRRETSSACVIDEYAFGTANVNSSCSKATNPSLKIYYSCDLCKCGQVLILSSISLHSDANDQSSLKCS